jgi:hypothetical protein
VDGIASTGEAVTECWFCNEHASVKLASGRVALPACRCCRQLAGWDGREGFQKPRELAGTILRAFDVRYRKLLDMPLWSEDELDELDYHLRTSVAATVAAARIIHIRRAAIMLRVNS